MSLSLALAGLLGGTLPSPVAPAPSALPAFSLPAIARPAPAGLRSPLLGADESLPRRLALRAAQQPEGGGGAAAAPADDEPNIELLRVRERMARTHRALGITTFAAMSVTTFFGIISAINNPTAFGPGACNSPYPPSNGGSTCVFGNFGSTGVDTLHGVFSVATTALYATTGGFALAMPDPERASSGDDRRALRIRMHRGLAYAHLVGMILQPLLGFLSVSGLGLTGQAAADFSAAMRTTHVLLGTATYGLYTGAMLTELLP